MKNYLIKSEWSEVKRDQQSNKSCQFIADYDCLPQIAKQFKSSLRIQANRQSLKPFQKQLRDSVLEPCSPAEYLQKSYFQFLELAGQDTQQCLVGMDLQSQKLVEKPQYNRYSHSNLKEFIYDKHKYEMLKNSVRKRRVDASLNPRKQFIAMERAFHNSRNNLQITKRSQDPPSRLRNYTNPDFIVQQPAENRTKSVCKSMRQSVVKINNKQSFECFIDSGGVDKLGQTKYL